MSNNSQNFHCRKKCGDPEFSIKDWNEAFLYCIDNDLSEAETDKILDGTPCETQCFTCVADVGERMAKTKELLRDTNN